MATPQVPGSDNDVLRLTERRWIRRLIDAMNFTRTPVIEEAFWKLVEKRDGDDACWIWKGRTSVVNGRKQPYFSRGLYKCPAQRYAFQSTTGKSIGRAKLLRRCNELMCVRPDHYEVGNLHPQTAAELAAQRAAADAELKAKIVAVVSSPELRVRLSAPVDVSRLLKELETQRQLLSMVMRAVSEVSDAQKALASDVAGIADAPPGVTKADLKAVLAAELAALRPFLPVEPDGTVEPQRTEPAQSSDTGVDPARYLEREFAALAGPLSAEDQSNLATVASLASSHAGARMNAVQVAAAWLSTFASLSESGVVDKTSSQFVEAAKQGWLNGPDDVLSLGA